LTTDFIGPDGAQKTQAIDIARLLGWIRVHGERDGVKMKKVAEACSAAARPISGALVAIHAISIMSFDEHIASSATITVRSAVGGANLTTPHDARSKCERGDGGEETRSAVAHFVICTLE
jgi:hypothetical protein